jgi:hypothetical protein
MGVLLAALLCGPARSAESGPRPELATRVMTASAQAPPRSSTTTLSVLGTIERYNPSTHVLSVTTPTGTLSCRLASTTRVRQGWHKLDEEALEKLVGYRAAVRYADTDTSKTVDSVHVFGR